MVNNDDRYTYQVERPGSSGSYNAVPQPPALPPLKKKNPMFTLIALFLIFTLVVGGTGGIVGYYISQNGAAPDQPYQNTFPVLTPSPPETPQKADPPPAVSQAAAPLDGALTIQEIFARGDKSTVAISTSSGGTNIFGQPTEKEAAGSGFILTADGYVLSNHHVIEDATSITVMLHDETEYPAEIIGSDPITDIAVLKINAVGLSPVRLGNSDKLLVGDLAVAIGNPLGELANSLTVGYISAKKRIVYIDSTPRVMLQTDASVSPGNSGGPLFNIHGEVIGVVSAKTVASGVEGIGFAIPVNIAVDIANELMQYGRIMPRPLLGVTAQDSSSVQNGNEYPKGAYISEVTSRSSAANAGIKKGDVITAFNGERVTGLAELLITLNGCRVGNTVTATVWRDGQELFLPVILDTEKPNETQQEEERRPIFPWGR